MMMLKLQERIVFNMNREIILRVRGPEGQYRITVGARDTYGELLIQVRREICSFPAN